MAQETKKAPEKQIPLTEEQENVLNDIYKYTDEATLSDEELTRLGEMFKSQSDFQLLRKALAIFSFDEVGLGKPTSVAMMGNPDDLALFGQKVAINAMADDKVRSGLVSLYNRLKEKAFTDKKAEFENKNAKDFAEKKTTEEFEDEQEVASRRFGVNV